MTETVSHQRCELVGAPLDRQIADNLLQLLGEARPRRLARMSELGERKRDGTPRGKYEDISGPLTRSMMERHARGDVTYAATLDQGGKARAGVIEIDQGGRAAIDAVLQAAERLGLIAYAFELLSPDGIHSGGHVWFVYDDWYSVADIIAQLDQVLRLAGLPATTELWPRDKAHNRGSDQGIRLPFGYHRPKATRGALRSQAGEIILLDTDLTAGFDLVTGLRLNSAPPAIVSPIGDKQASDKAHYAKSGHVQTRRAPVHTVRPAPGVRASLADVKAQFNAEHTWPELLRDYGGTETRDGWACNCGHQHSHTTQIVITSQDKIVSFSPDCGWAPHRGSGRALDRFGFYVQVEHSGNVIAALQALNPIPPAPAPEYIDTRDDAERWASQHAAEFGTDYVLAPAELERRASEAQRKRQAHRTYAAATIADVRSRAAVDDDLTDADRAVLDALLTVAGDRGWCRPSKEQIAKISGVPLGTVKRAMFSAAKGGRLDGRYFTSQGKGGGAKLTAIRTFLRGSITPALIHESYSTCDLIPESRACELRAVIPPIDRVQSDPAELLERLSFASYLRNLAAELGEVLDLAELAALSMVDQEACEARLLSQLADGVSGEFPQIAKSEMISDYQIEHADVAGAVVTGPAGAVATLGGAAYVPQGAEGWYQAIQIPKILEFDDQAESAAAPEQLLDLVPEPEPLVRCPPTEPNAAREYWALKNKKPINFKQSRWIAYRLAELEIWRPASEAPTVEPRPLAPARAAPLRRRRAAIAVASAERADSGQMQLELASSAGGFARALVESSPALTSSLGP